MHEIEKGILSIYQVTHSADVLYTWSVPKNFAFVNTKKEWCSARNFDVTNCQVVAGAILCDIIDICTIRGVHISGLYSCNMRGCNKNNNELFLWQHNY